MAETATAKKPRRTRTDYRRKYEDLMRYAQISLEVIEAVGAAVNSCDTPAFPNEFMKGQAAALRAVLERDK